MTHKTYTKKIGRKINLICSVYALLILAGIIYAAMKLEGAAVYEKQVINDFKKQQNYTEKEKMYFADRDSLLALSIYLKKCSDSLAVVAYMYDTNKEQIHSDLLPDYQEKRNALTKLKKIIKKYPDSVALKNEQADLDRSMQMVYKTIAQKEDQLVELLYLQQALYNGQGNAKSLYTTAEQHYKVDSIWYYSAQNDYIYIKDDLRFRKTRFDRVQMVASYGFWIGILFLFFIYAWWLDGTRSLKNMLRIPYEYHANNNAGISINQLEKIQADIREYYNTTIDKWQKLIGELLQHFSGILLLSLAFILTPWYQWASLLIFFIVCIVVNALKHLSAQYPFPNRVFFAFKIAAGFDFFKNHRNKNGEYCLFLRNFSSENAMLEDLNFWKILSGVFDEVDDTRFEQRKANRNTGPAGGTATRKKRKEFSTLLFRHIKKKLPVFYFANMDDKKPPDEIIPVYSKNEDWFDRVCELIDNATLIIMYITDFTQGVEDEYNYIFSKKFQGKTIIILDEERYEEGFSLGDCYNYVFYRDEILEKCKSKNGDELFAALNLDVILNKTSRRAA